MTKLTPLKKINVSSWEKRIQSLELTADTNVKTKSNVSPSIPGVGNPSKKTLDITKDKAGDSSKKVKKVIQDLLMGVMAGLPALSGATGIPGVPGIPGLPGVPIPNVDVNAKVEYINEQVEKLNKLITKIEKILNDLYKFIKSISKIIKIVVIAYIAAKIISFIPAITIPLVGPAFTAHLPASEAIKTACIIILVILVGIPFAIIAIMYMLLSLFSFIGMILGMISNYMKLQDDIKKEKILDSLKTADDLENTSDVKDYTDKLDVNKLNDDGSMTNNLQRLDLMRKISNLDFQNLVECTLPGGEVRKMTPKNCLAMGGTFGNRDDLETQLNNLGGPLSIDELLSGNLLNLGNCTLPDGSVEQMTLEDCLAVGGIFGDISSELIITSLKYPDRDATIEKATKIKGKRIGFYQA